MLSTVQVFNSLPSHWGAATGFEKRDRFVGYGTVRELLLGSASSLSLRAATVLALY